MTFILKTLRFSGISIIGLLAAMTPAAHAEGVSDFFGKWTVTRIAGYGDVGSGEKQARKGIGKPVVISAEGIRMPGYLCDKHAVTYQVESVDAVLAGGWEATRQDLDLGHFKLGQQAGHLDAVCADGLVLDHDDLLMTSGSGAFYIVHRG